MPEHIDAVRVMTVHKAKGLEFSVVIVPFHHWAKKLDNLFIGVAWEDKKLMMPLTKGASEDFYIRYMEMVQEDINLLYVAWTRAIDELYGFITGTRYHKSRSPVLSILDILSQKMGWNTKESPWEHGTKPAALCIPDSPPNADQEEQQQEPPAPYALRLATPMAWLPQLKIFRNPLGDPSLLEDRMRGRLVHRALECLRLEGDIAVCVEKAVNRAFADFPPSPLIRRVGEEEVREMLRWLLSVPLFPDWLKNGRAECSLMDEKGNLHRMDCLVIDGDEAIVIDYKTGKPSEEYKVQVRGYLRLLRSTPLFSQCDPRITKFRGILVYLDDRRMQEVR